MLNSIPISEPLTNRSVLTQTRKIIQSSPGHYFALIGLAIGLPVLLRVLLGLTLFPEDGMGFGGGGFAFLGGLWWNLGVRSTVYLVLALFEVIWVIAVIVGVGTLIAANRLHGERVAPFGTLRTVLSQSSTRLTFSYFLAFLLFVALVLFTFFGTFVLIGVLGTPLLLFCLGAWVPFIAPVILLEQGALSQLLYRAWYLGKQSIMFSLRMILLLGTAYFLVNWLINRFLGSNTLAADVASQIVNYTLLTLAVIVSTLLYYNARLQYDGSMGGAEQLASNAPVSEPIFTREDWRTVLRIAAIIGGAFVAVAVVLTVLAVGWLFFNQQQLLEGVAEFETWLYSSGILSTVSTGIRIFQTLTDPESLAQIEQSLQSLVTATSELTNLEESITTLLDPETLAALQSSIDPAAGDLEGIPNAEEVEAALSTLLSPENIQAIESAFGSQ